MESAIKTSGLTKKFKEKIAVSNLNLDIKPGEIFGLLGPDGAGKTTTIRMLSTAMEQTSGQARVLGLDITTQEENIRRRIGYMPQQFSLYRDLNVDENLEFFAQIYRIEKSFWQKKKIELLDFTKLSEFSRKKAQTLSGGMQKKLALACSLIHTPEVLFLDEPTTGVDPISRREFWRIINTLLKVTIFIATPYIDEAERCHRVGLMREGKLLICDTPNNIKKETRTSSLEQAFIALVEKK
jgi:ABC-2 type transport system ATP-binding protein